MALLFCRDDDGVGGKHEGRAVATLQITPVGAVGSMGGWGKEEEEEEECHTSQWGAPA